MCESVCSNPITIHIRTNAGTPKQNKKGRYLQVTCDNDRSKF